MQAFQFFDSEVWRSLTESLGFDSILVEETALNRMARRFCEELAEAHLEMQVLFALM